MLRAVGLVAVLHVATGYPQHNYAHEAALQGLLSTTTPSTTTPKLAAQTAKVKATLRGGATGAEDPHAWATKGASSARSSASALFSGPRTLAAPAWTLEPGTSHENQTPVIGPDGTIYIAGADGTMRKLTTEGDTVWSLDLFPSKGLVDSLFKHASYHTSLSTPTLTADANGKQVVYVTPLSGYHAIALDADSGAVLFNVTCNPSGTFEPRTSYCRTC